MSEPGVLDKQMRVFLATRVNIRALCCLSTSRDVTKSRRPKITAHNRGQTGSPKVFAMEHVRAGTCLLELLNKAVNSNGVGCINIELDPLSEPLFCSFSRKYDFDSSYVGRVSCSVCVGMFC
jgi:hypothetical protein